MRRGLGLAVVVAALAVAAAATAARIEAPSVQASSYLLTTTLDGRSLLARAPDEPRPMASLTKLMTVLVARDHLRPETIVTVPAAATAIGESSIYLRAGQRLPARDLYVGALVPSANDAATALAIVSARGSQPRFVRWMNRKAKQLGLRNTRFLNPHGLDAPGHQASARDLAKLLTVALDDPLIRRYSRMSSAILSNGVRVDSTDNLIDRFRGFVGGKTGHTGDAGWAQVAAVQRDGVTVTAVVLGDPTEAQRDADLAALLRYGLASYRVARIVDPARVYATVEVGWGRRPLELVAARAVAAPVPAWRPLVEKAEAPLVAKLPIHRGQQLGWVSVRDGARLVARRPLVAARAVPEPTSLEKARYLARRTFGHLFGWLT
ncbi:MAG: D-alanyl-D-alanine carboxypeptidase family protein [Gaiellales bacterium]